MRPCSTVARWARPLRSQTEAEISGEEPTVFRARHLAKCADPWTGEEQRPHPRFATKVRSVRPQHPRRLPRAKRRRSNTEAGSHVAEPADIAEGGASGRDPRLDVQRDVLSMAALAIILASDKPQRRRDFL